MVKVMLFEVSGRVPPLPYMPVPEVPGLVTVIWTVAAVAMAEAGMAAVSWLPFTYVVACAAPLQFTIAFVLNLLPLTVRVNPGLPAVMLAGASCAIAGTLPAAGGVLFEL